MKRISEEQKAILGCYETISKEDAIQQISAGLELAEDNELREMMEGVVQLLQELSETEYPELLEECELYRRLDEEQSPETAE